MSALARRVDEQFYDLFEAAIANALRSAELLRQMLDEFPDGAGLAREILIAEQEGDRITQAIIRELAGRSRPPFSRSTSHRLATEIDDIVDHIEQIADCFGLYKIEAPMDPALALAQVLVDAVAALGRAIAALRDGRPASDQIVAVHGLENDGDRLSREAIASLFAGGVDPMVVIRWKDIFEQLEHAIDSCEAVAHTLEGGSFVGGA